MTIASEISRLQTDKEAMRQAIISKWVSVDASVSFDDYAACILAIQTPIPEPFIDLLVVGGGGWWSAWEDRYIYRWWWGWWAGWYIYCEAYPLDKECSQYNVLVWAWWVWKNTSAAANVWHWWNSCFGSIVACWGWQWWYENWCDWWSWGWGWGNRIWCWIVWQWHNGWWIYWQYWWWWGWAAEAGCNWKCTCWWKWWDWCLNSISWEAVYYSWWGWGSWYSCPGWLWWCWWWNWSHANANWCDAPCYWWWWGGGWKNGTCRWWNWCQWVVILRYKTDWTCWIKPSSTWWCKYTCWEYTIHCFTSSWTFIPAYK